MNTNTIQLMQDKIKFNTHRVCDLLQWTLDKYQQHQFETAMQYLEEYYSGDAVSIKTIAAQTSFWGWFISLWNARNEAFLYDCDGREDEYTPQYMAKAYRLAHIPGNMACEIAPPRCIYPAHFPTIKLESYATATA